VEVEILSRSLPKTGGKSVSRVGSVASLRGGRGRRRRRGRAGEEKILEEIVDTSVDGEGWSWMNERITH